MFKRSGEIAEWGCQWQSHGLGLYQAIAARLDSEALTAKFPHRVCQLLEPYLTTRADLSKLSDATDFDATVSAIIEREFAHAVSRQSQQGTAEANAQALLPLLREYLEHLTTTSDSPAQTKLQALIGLCTTVAFAHRTLPQTTTPKGKAEP